MKYKYPEQTPTKKGEYKVHIIDGELDIIDKDMWSANMQTWLFNPDHVVEWEEIK